MKINSDKTKLIFFNTGTNSSFANNFFFRANNDIIKPKSNITILGFVLSSNLSTDNHINTIIPSLHNRINTIKSIQNVTDEKTRLQLANSIVIGKLNHALPLLSNISLYGKAKLHKILMTTARTVIGHYGFKWSCTKILNNCNWPNIDDMIKLSSLKLLHYIITNRSPTNIFNKMKIPKRNTSEITLKAIPQT